MKPIVRRIERLEAMHGGNIPPFPNLQRLTEERERIAIGKWWESFVDWWDRANPTFPLWKYPTMSSEEFDEHIKEVGLCLAREITDEEGFALAKYLEVKLNV